MSAPSTETQPTPHQETVTPSTSWRPGLDGLRALAVIAVLAYHEPQIGLPGGFLGVDLFFVLSGFLITGLMLDEHHRTGALSLRGFWYRRARRLLPALALLLAGVMALAWWEHNPLRLDDLPQQVGAAIAYASNWQQVTAGTSYFTAYDAVSPLRHLWSLAVEEQFYVVWPLVVVAVLALSRRRAHRRGVDVTPRHGLKALALTTGTFAAASALAMVLLADLHDPTRVYYGTDTRAFEMLIGALGAMWFWHRSARSTRSGAIGVTLLVALIATVVLVNDRAGFMYRGGFVIFALATAALVVIAAGHNACSKVLAHPWLRRIGALSYALYLWHWPVQVFLSDARLPFPDTPAGNLGAVAVRLTVTVIAALASTYLLEARIRSSKLSLSHMLSAWAALGAVVVVCAVVAAPSKGSLIDLTTTQSSAASAHDLVVVGDSVGITLGKGLQAVAGDNLDVGVEARVGCAMLQAPRTRTHDGGWVEDGTGCPDHLAQFQDIVMNYQPQAVLVVSGAWDVYDRDWGQGPLAPGDEDFDLRYRNALEDSLRVLRAGGADVVVATTSCFAPRPGESMRPEMDPARSATLARIQQEVADELNLQRRDSQGEVNLVDLRSITCEGGFAWERDGVDWRPDGVHFSPDGAKVAARWVLSELPQPVRDRLGITPPQDAGPSSSAVKLPQSNPSILRPPTTTPSTSPVSPSTSSPISTPSTGVDLDQTITWVP